MATRRQQRVDELIRREIAELLVRGDLRDPRLEPGAAISITAVDVSPDLANARVFVDVLSSELELARVLRALEGAAGAIRAMLGKKLTMRRLPRLHFEHDASVGRGAKIAEILHEIAESSPKVAEPEPAAGSSSAPAGEPNGERDAEP